MINPGRFLLLLVLSVFFPLFSQAAEKPVVKVGITLPLTGDLAYMGEGARNALMMAQSGLPADTKYKYELVFEDDMLQAKKAAATSNKMISVDKVDALISLGSGTGGVVSPIAERNKVIHFGIASAASVADGDYNFNHWTSPREESRLMVEELKKRGLKKVAGFFLNQEGMLAIRESLKADFKNAGITLVSDQMVNPGEKDLRTVIAKAKASNPDIYLLGLYTPELEILGKQIKEAGITTPRTAIESFSLSDQQALFEGMWYVDSAQAKESFAEQYKAKFGKEPSFGSPNAYDAFTLIVRGYETADAPMGVKPSHESVVKALYKVKNFDGMLGSLSIDSKGVVFSRAAVKMIKDGKPVQAGG